MAQERRMGSRSGKQDREPIPKMDLFQWRLKSCVRCGLEHLGRDFPGYSEGGNGKKSLRQTQARANAKSQTHGEDN